MFNADQVMQVIVNAIIHISKIVILMKQKKGRLNEHFPVFKVI